MNPLWLNPGPQGSQRLTRPPLSNPSSHPPRPVSAAPPPGAGFQAPGRQAGAPRPTRRHQKPVPPIPGPNVGLNVGLYVLFKVGKNPITHIDACIHNTDPLFFDELKRVYKRERGWLRERFSIWRYHHCNFDKVIDSLCSTAKTKLTESSIYDHGTTSSALNQPEHEQATSFLAHRTTSTTTLSVGPALMVRRPSRNGNSATCTAHAAGYVAGGSASHTSATLLPTFIVLPLISANPQMHLCNGSLNVRRSGTFLRTIVVRHGD
jgi:hypothetical protein